MVNGKSLKKTRDVSQNIAAADPLVAVPSAMHEQCTAQQFSRSPEISVCFCMQEACGDTPTLATLAGECHKKLQEKVIVPASIKAQLWRSCIHPHARLACHCADPLVAVPFAMHERCTVQRLAEAQKSVCFCMQEACKDPSTLAALAGECHRKLQEKVMVPASIKAQLCNLAVITIPGLPAVLYQACADSLVEQ